MGLPGSEKASDSNARLNWGRISSRAPGVRNCAGGAKGGDFAGEGGDFCGREGRFLRARGPILRARAWPRRSQGFTSLEDGTTNVSTRNGQVYSKYLANMSLFGVSGVLCAPSPHDGSLDPVWRAAGGTPPKLYIWISKYSHLSDPVVKTIRPRMFGRRTFRESDSNSPVMERLNKGLTLTTYHYW
eukprot:1186283-Prorocentrum_minimum.AAC.1